MYVCLCKAVTDRQLESAMEQGLCSRRQLVECFGVGRDCGKCNKDIAAILDCRQRRLLEHALNDAEFAGAVA